MTDINHLFAGKDLLPLPLFFVAPTTSTPTPPMVDHLPADHRCDEAMVVDVPDLDLAVYEAKLEESKERSRGKACNSNIRGVRRMSTNQVPDLLDNLGDDTFTEMDAKMISDALDTKVPEEKRPRSHHHHHRARAHTPLRSTASSCRAPSSPTSPHLHITVDEAHLLPFLAKQHLPRTADNWVQTKTEHCHKTETTTRSLRSLTPGEMAQAALDRQPVSQLPPLPAAAVWGEPAPHREGKSAGRRRRGRKGRKGSKGNDTGSNHFMVSGKGEVNSKERKVRGFPWDKICAGDVASRYPHFDPSSSDDEYPPQDSIYGGGCGC